MVDPLKGVGSVHLSQREWESAAGLGEAPHFYIHPTSSAGPDGTLALPVGNTPGQRPYRRTASYTTRSYVVHALRHFVPRP